MTFPKNIHTTYKDMKRVPSIVALEMKGNSVVT